LRVAQVATSNSPSNVARMDIVVIFLLCTSANAMNGRRKRIMTGGLVNPINQAFCSRFRHASQIDVTCSRHQMSIALGR
jgi:hypothetical protein